MSASKIESTSNYSRFKFMAGNRPVEERRVNKLIVSIKRKNLLQSFPIVCQRNDTGLYIMDGQHRFTAAKALGLPIYFVENKNLTIEDMMLSNGNQKAWRGSDFVSSFAQQGNEDYIALQDFAALHRLPISTSARLLSGTLNGEGGSSSGIHDGSFKVTDAALANKVASAVSASLRLFRGARDNGFVLALYRLLRTSIFSITRFISKLENQPSKMVKCGTWIQYVELIEEIYNWKVRAQDIAALTIECRKMLTRGENKIS